MRIRVRVRGGGEERGTHSLPLRCRLGTQRQQYPAYCISFTHTFFK